MKRECNTTDDFSVTLSKMELFRILNERIDPDEPQIPAYATVRAYGEYGDTIQILWSKSDRKDLGV